MPDVVERFIGTFTSHDWDEMRACVTDDFSRTGPDGVYKASPEEFIAFLAEVMPKLVHHSVEIRRITYAGDRAFGEFTESIERDGRMHHAPQCLVLDMAPDGRISRLRTFMQRRGDPEEHRSW